jgi:hypothetical protein
MTGQTVIKHLLVGILSQFTKLEQIILSINRGYHSFIEVLQKNCHSREN